MITVIFGDPGVGKSALLTSFLRVFYRERGIQIMRSCCNRIFEVNQNRENPLSYPVKVPIFTDYKVSFLVGYEKNYESYFTNGFYFGLPHDEYLPTIYVPPYSVIGLSEVQRYYDSKKKNLPSWVSRTFEMHRHYGLEIYLDLQRFFLLDKNIRDIAGRFIEVVEMNHKTNAFGGIVSTVWTCREWTSNGDCELYLNNGVKNFKTVKYSFNGNIFNCYDSYNYKDKFLPPDDKDFTYLPHVSNVPEEVRSLYDFSQPQGYR